MLGTIVEIGVVAQSGSAVLEPAVEAAFAAIAEVQRCLSRFDGESDIARFNELRAGSSVRVRGITMAALDAARQLRDESDGLFDITQGSGPLMWRCVEGVLHKSSATVRLDLGGIGKGDAVDAAVAALMAHGCSAGWVNAGGDLRAFGDVDVPVWLRDETRGGATPFATLADGAFATSRYAADSRSACAGHNWTAGEAHVSVAAPLCMWADALTKVVALSGNSIHPLLARYGATAWLHAAT